MFGSSNYMEPFERLMKRSEGLLASTSAIYVQMNGGPHSTAWRITRGRSPSRSLEEQGEGSLNAGRAHHAFNPARLSTLCSVPAASS